MMDLRVVRPVKKREVIEKVISTGMHLEGAESAICETCAQNMEIECSGTDDEAYKQSNDI